MLQREAPADMVRSVPGMSGRSHREREDRAPLNRPNQASDRKADYPPMLRHIRSAFDRIGSTVCRAKGDVAMDIAQANG
jgi:hypothetical protein